jgi:uncharacterized protein
MEPYIRYFASTWGGQTPLFKLFQTEFGNYLYDPGTNKLLRCNDVCYAALQTLQILDPQAAVDALVGLVPQETLTEALQEIIDTIEREHILLSKPHTLSFNSLHFTSLDEELAENLGQVILEVTERCNLRCVYCVYNDIVPESRNHGTKAMTLGTACKAVDYLRAHSARQAKPTIGFYGGEPLTRFSFMVNCIDYARRVFGSRELSFALTTNGTLVTPEIAQYLAHQHVYVTLSIDGPKDIHDKYRVYSDGRGTFDAAMLGLRQLIDAYGSAAAEMINLSMVYTPPFSSKRLEHIASLWTDYPWIGSLTPSMTYPHRGSIPISMVPTEEELVEDKGFYEWAMDSYFEAYVNGRKPNRLVESTVERGLVLLFRRQIVDRPNESIHLNGCCVPGARKIYVTTDGFIAVCERIHMTAPYLGHVDTGIDCDAVRRVYVEGYAEESLKRCASCWAHRMCSICYTDTFANGNYDDGKKAILCEGVRDTIEERLKLYTRLLCVNPRGLNHLADVEIS